MSRPKPGAAEPREGGDADHHHATPPKNEHPPIRVIQLSDIKPAPYNPRAISDNAINGLAASLKKFGVVEPIVWNKRTQHIVGGHQRYEVLKQMGKTEAQVVVVDLNDAEEKALNVTLNNPNITGQFTEGLQEILIALQLEDETMLEALRLDTLIVDFTPVNVEDQGALDKKTMVTCPKCQHEFES